MIQLHIAFAFKNHLMITSVILLCTLFLQQILPLLGTLCLLVKSVSAVPAFSIFKAFPHLLMEFYYTKQQLVHNIL